MRDLEGTFNPGKGKVRTQRLGTRRALEAVGFLT
jgi:hypothetical protein